MNIADPRMSRLCKGILFVVLMLSMAQVLAQSAVDSAVADEAIGSPLTTLAPIVVTGSMPGPGMWRVANGGGNELWILGIFTPTPATIEWDSTEVMETLSRAQVVLWPPYFTVDVEAGVIGKLSLGYSYMKAKNNPDGQRLEKVLPPETYARWERLRHQYLPRDSSIERKRPLVAADTLLAAAIKRVGLTSERRVENQIVAAVGRGRERIRAPRYEYRLSGDDARALLKQSRSIEMNDIGCLTATMDLVEYGLGRTVSNANAWATGDIQALQLDELERRDTACADVFSNPQFLRKGGMPDVRSSVMQSWMRAAEKSLKNNTTTLALLPITDVLKEGGYLEQLRAAGYAVEESP